jgi:hypothetical protein
MLPTTLYYHSFAAHTTFIIVITMFSIFNGADYYIEVFSRRYVVEMEKLEVTPALASRASQRGNTSDLQALELKDQEVKVK